MTGFMKKINKEVRTMNVEKMEDIDTVVEELRQEQRKGI